MRKVAVMLEECGSNKSFVHAATAGLGGLRADVIGASVRRARALVPVEVRAALGASVRQNRVAASETRSRFQARYDLVLRRTSPQSIVSWGDPRFSNARPDEGLLFTKGAAQYRLYVTRKVLPMVK